MREMNEWQKREYRRRMWNEFLGPLVAVLVFFAAMAVCMVFVQVPI